MFTKKNRRIDEIAYIIKKRLPEKFVQNRNHFYITKKTNVQSQIKRIEELLNNQSDQVYVHGLGASLNKALILAVELQKKFSGAVEYHINTSTINVTDDIFPMSDEFELGVRNRPLSAVHITLRRVHPS